MDMNMDMFTKCSSKGFDLLNGMMTLHPGKRCDAKKGLAMIGQWQDEETEAEAEADVKEAELMNANDKKMYDTTIEETDRFVNVELE